MNTTKTPRDKYLSDPEYRQLVLTMESFIERAQFTPSEMRQAVVLACINYEMRHACINYEMRHACINYEMRQTAIDREHG